MNNEELKAARIAEAIRRFVEDSRERLEILVDFYETCWIPPVSDDLLAADGWVMVPREPTEAMIKAAWADLGDTYQRSTRNLADAYRAMLSAAPKEPDHG